MHRSPEETTLLRLLVKLIEDYEETNYHLQEWQTLSCTSRNFAASFRSG